MSPQCLPSALLAIVLATVPLAGCEPPASRSADFGARPRSDDPLGGSPPGVTFAPRDFAVQLECQDTNECVAPYLRFLQEPEVLAAAPRLENCEELVDGWIQAALDDRQLLDGASPVGPGDDIGAAILQGTGMGFLFDPEALEERPLQVVQRSETVQVSDMGDEYTLREMLLIDPLVGQVQVQHLLPLPLTGSVPTVVILPGHSEDADTHRLQRFGQFLPELGFAVVIVSFRAWEQRADHDATEAVLCHGLSMMMLRGYEAMLAMRFAEAAPESRGRAIGLLGHSGGSMVGNLLAWLDVNPAVVHVSDLDGDYRNAGPADDELPAVDCATHPVLSLMSPAINDLQRAPVPVFQVPYGYATDEAPWDSEPPPWDPAPMVHFVPVFQAFLLE